MKFQKVSKSTDGGAGRMATVAEVEANYKKVQTLLDDWTIALLDGGKVDGHRHGGGVHKGNFEEQCGEKIIVIEDTKDDNGKDEKQEYFYIVSKLTGMVLEASPTWNETKKPPIFVDERNIDDPTQQWKWSGDTLVNELHDMVLDIKNGETHQGNTLQMWEYNGTPAQKWQLEDGQYLVSKLNGLLLDVKDGSTESGTIVQMWPKNSTPSQQWTLEAQSIDESSGNLGQALGELLMVGLQMGELASSFEQMEKVQKDGKEQIKKLTEGPRKAYEKELENQGGVAHYKTLIKESDGDFQVPEGWKMIPMMQLVHYMDEDNNPGDNPELSKFMKYIFTSGAGEGFPESMTIITNKKVVMEIDGREVHKVEREEDRSFTIQEGWVEVPKSDETIQKMVDLVSTKHELELFQKGDLLFIAKKVDGEPDYKAVRSDEGGKFDIPAGWSVVGIMDPAMETLMPRFMTGPQDVDDFNNGKMVIITNKPGAGPKEDWILVEKENGEFKAPDGYKIMDIDESNIGEYMDRIQHLINQSVCEKFNNGTIKLALKEKPKEEASSIKIEPSAPEESKIVSSKISPVQGGKVDGEPDYKAVRSDVGGKFDIPAGWGVVSLHDPAMETLMPRFMTGPQDVDDFYDGKLVIITNKPGAGPKEDWILVEKDNGEFKAPDGYKIMDIDESNIGEYMDRIQHLNLSYSVCEKINNGTIKLALKEKPKEEASLGDLFGAMGSLMTAFAPKEDAESNQVTDLTFKKVPFASEGRIATVAEIGANQEKVALLLDTWTIAFLNGGKIDGKGYGGKIQEGSFEEQCGEKIIVLEEEDETVKFISTGDAGIHRKTRMGVYNKSKKMVKGCPIFEQVDQQEGEDKQYLYVGPNGCWRVGPDFNSWSNSVLKNPKKNQKMPPKTGWQFYLNDKWIQDDSLQLFVKEEGDQGAGCNCSIIREWRDIRNITCLGIAIAIDNPEAVKTSLGKGCDINFDKIDDWPEDDESHRYSDDGGWTPLMLASRWSSLPVVSLLIGQPGIEIDKKNKRGETALAFAVKRKDNLEMVTLLVEFGAAPELKCKYGYSHLHRAAEAGHLDTVKYLHSIGANLKTQDNGMTTPLWLAVFKGNLPMVQYLADNGAKLNSPKAWYGFYPINAACHKGDVDMVKFLIDRGVDVTVKSGEDMSNLQIAQKEMNHGFSYEVEEKKPRYEEVIRMLEEAKEGSNPVKDMESCNCSIKRVTMESGYGTFKNITCLGIAILQDDIEAVKTSLGKGCDVNFDRIGDDPEDDYHHVGGWTPLIMACRWSSLPVVSLLLGQPGIEIDKKNEREETALAWAVKMRDNLEMVKLLVEAGVEPELKMENVWIGDYGELDTVKYLQSKGADLNTALTWAVTRKENALVKHLVEAGASPDLKDSYGYSHLHQAAQAGQLDIVKYLHSKGADINTRDNGLTTPLWLAAYNGDLPMVRYLASQGASLDTPRAWFGYFPLNGAVANGHVDVVKILIEQGADVNKENEAFGSHYGWEMSNIEIAQKAMDKLFGKEIEAKKGRYEEILRILREAGAKDVDGAMLNELVLETLGVMNELYVEKIEYVGESIWPCWDWPNKAEMPKCLMKIRNSADKEEAWLQVVKSLVEGIPKEDPLGPTVIAIIIERCKTHANFRDRPINVDTLLKACDMVSSFTKNDPRHRNMCIVISCIAGELSQSLSWFGDHSEDLRVALLTPTTMEYLCGNIDPNKDPEITLFSLLALENFADAGEGENKNLEKICKCLKESGGWEHLLKDLGGVGQIGTYSEESEDWGRRQVGFCNRWLMDSLLDVPGQEVSKTTNKLQINKMNKRMKMDPKGLEIRCDAPWMESASFCRDGGFSQGSWYYEVLLVTSGIMQIGWATEQSRLMEDKGFGPGDDKLSVGYDGCRQIIWYNARTKPQTEVEKWKPGDVVGCLIDIDNQEVVFSINGVSLEPNKQVFEEAKTGFFAVASLSSFQQCKFNFGEDPFKHPPTGRKFNPVEQID